MFSLEDIIRRYEKIVERWNSDPRQTLKRLFPGKYKEIHAKLEALKAGSPYRIYDATDEVKKMIMDMGAKMWGVQQMYDGTGRVVKDFRKCNNNKTDIPEFVDKLINEYRR